MEGQCPGRVARDGERWGGTGEHDDFTPTTWQAVVPCNVPLRTNPSTVPCADWFGSSADHGDWGCHKSQTLFAVDQNYLCREDQRLNGYMNDR